MSAKPPRSPWNDFPDVLIHASESAVKQHPRYPAAKSGDAEAAIVLVRDTLNLDQVEALGEMFPRETPTLVSAHAYEREGVNAIPEALADELGRRLGWPVDSEIVQSNRGPYRRGRLRTPRTTSHLRWRYRARSFVRARGRLRRDGRDTCQSSGLYSRQWRCGIGGRNTDGKTVFSQVVTERSAIEITERTTWKRL